MKVDSKRIFISDLPDAATEKDIEQKFGHFGQVTSIEIKKRKDIGPKNKTQQFAFINIDIDDRQLKNCFDDFTSKKWKGSYVEIQLAKESFLDRLKRERELAQANGTAAKQEIVTEKTVEPIKKTPINGEKKIVKKYESSESSEDSSSEEEKPVVKRVVNVEVIKPEEDIYEDIVVKNNKFKKFNNKIEGFGKEPVVVIEKKKKTMDPSRQAADKKRINSMLEMKRSYNKQKSVIKSALSKIDVDANNARKLTEIDSKGVKRKAEKSTDKKSLFDEDDENDEEINLEVKEQFQGKKGQQLFELQSKYKNDKRFQMDSRFAEAEEEEESAERMDEEEITGEEESRKQLEILGEVLGKKITPRQSNTEKAMLRFDPSQPEHTKYEIKEQEKKKSKKKNKETQEKIALPEVSTEKFYQVTENLKQSLQEKESFSLLNMFGRKNDVEEDKEEEKEEVVEGSEKVIKKVKGGKEKNPFRYDSTDDEGEERVPKKIELIGGKDDESKEEAQKVRLGPAKIWSEPFFFKKDDYRFQEGIAFMKKLQTIRSDLLTQRKEVREIVKYRMNRNMKKQSKSKYKSGQRKLANRMKRK